MGKFTETTAMGIALGVAMAGFALFITYGLGQVAQAMAGAA